MYKQNSLTLSFFSFALEHLWFERRLVPWGKDKSVFVSEGVGCQLGRGGACAPDPEEKPPDH